MFDSAARIYIKAACDCRFAVTSISCSAPKSGWGVCANVTQTMRDSDRHGESELCTAKVVRMASSKSVHATEKL